MAEGDLDMLLLAAAKRDEQAFRALVAIADMNDVAIGFHAHQCIEKTLKSVLAHARIVYRRTHSLTELLDLLEDSGLGAPPFAAQLASLNPYALDARYETTEPPLLDRADAAQMVDAVIGWAETELRAPKQRQT